MAPSERLAVIEIAGRFAFLVLDILLDFNDKPLLTKGLFLLL